jgi:acyl-CoA reductase-like NAD-dependent aldehyde dehydrogenase
MKTVPLLINGEEVTSDITFDVVNPGSGETVFKAYGANPKLAIAAIEAAEKAFPAWSRTKPNERRALFFKAAQLLEERQEEVTKIQMDETSVDKGFAGGFQTAVSIGMLRECGSRVSTIEGSIPEPDEEGTSFICSDFRGNGACS